MLLFDIIESPMHPDLSALATGFGFERLAFTSQRKAMAQLKRRQPAVVIADFFYGYGNNYAGANVSNLDVLLRSLQRFAPQAATIVLAEKTEVQHVPKLTELFKLHAVVTLPTTEEALSRALESLAPGRR